jgi:MerR family transcriptional regulator, copper efflux regulator
MRIGSLARQAGVSARSLRHYEAKGLMCPPRSTNGYRDYPAAAIERVHYIGELLACGFSADEIRDFLPCFDDRSTDPGCAAGRERFRRKLAQVDSLIEQLQQRRTALLAQIESGTDRIA